MSQVLAFLNNELLKNKINDASLRLFNQKLNDKDMQSILDALELIFDQLEEIQKKVGDDNYKELYENTTFFLMDTLMAQMIGVILIKKKK
jgi:hypothetical protein